MNNQGKKVQLWLQILNVGNIGVEYGAVSKRNNSQKEKNITYKVCIILDLIFLKRKLFK